MKGPVLFVLVAIASAGCRGACRPCGAPLRLEGTVHAVERPAPPMSPVATVVPLGAPTLGPALLKAPSGPPKPPAPALGMTGVSGLVRLHDEHYLVVHDAKRNVAGAPHVGRLAVHKDGDHVTLDYVTIEVADWRGPEANDLEAAAAVPGRPHEALLSESGAQGGVPGRVFHVAFAEEHGVPTLRVLAAGALPDGVRDVEAIACVASASGELTLLVAERGESGQAARLHWGRIAVGGDALTITMSPHDVRELVVEYEGAVAPERSCSDLFVDAAGLLWGAGADDHGDDGPFRSVVYELGRAADATAHTSPLRGARFATVEGFKVEALCEGLRADELCVGTDDEDYGGCWRRIPLRAP